MGKNIETLQREFEAARAAKNATEAAVDAAWAGLYGGFPFESPSAAKVAKTMETVHADLAIASARETEAFNALRQAELQLEALRFPGGSAEHLLRQL